MFRGGGGSGGGGSGQASPDFACVCLWPIQCSQCGCRIALRPGFALRCRPATRPPLLQLLHSSVRPAGTKFVCSSSASASASASASPIYLIASGFELFPSSLGPLLLSCLRLSQYNHIFHPRRRSLSSAMRLFWPGSLLALFAASGQARADVEGEMKAIPVRINAIFDQCVRCD